MHSREAFIDGQINKRLTLNLLIQGAAAHTFLTAHHLVRDELEALDPSLPHLYDRVSVAMFLNYFIGDIALALGPSFRFWKRMGNGQGPFPKHRLLVEHGRELWLASKKHVCSRGWQKRVLPIPGLHYAQGIGLALKTAWAERHHRTALARIAEQATASMWNIDPGQLDGQLTTEVAFGNLREPQSRLGRIILTNAAGFGGVEFRQGRPTVVAKAWFWPLLLHELVKGTAELICLHGLCELGEVDYTEVLEATDHVEYETWMLQAGPELWRRFLAAKPAKANLAETLMNTARLEPPQLEAMMLSIVQD